MERIYNIINTLNAFIDCLMIFSCLYEISIILFCPNVVVDNQIYDLLHISHIIIGIVKLTLGYFRGKEVI